MKIDFKYWDNVKVISWFYEWMEWTLDSILYSDRKWYELYCIEPFKEEYDECDDMEKWIMITMDILNRQKLFYVRWEDLSLIK